jgi:hypothetical protein
MKFQRTIKRQLYVSLTAIERDTAVSDMIETIKYHNSIEDKKSEQNKTWNENLKVAAEKITDLAAKIENGNLCNVPCTMSIDPDANRVCFFRIDTGEMIEDRKMTEEDQIQLTDEKVEA